MKLPESLLTDEEIESLASEYAEGFDQFWSSGEPDMKLPVIFAQVKVREAQKSATEQACLKAFYSALIEAVNSSRTDVIWDLIKSLKALIKDTP